MNLKWAFFEIALVPLAVVTVTFAGPFCAAGVITVIEGGELNLTVRALVEPNLTAETPAKPVPVIVNDSPPEALPFFCDSAVTVGGGPAGTAIPSTVPVSWLRFGDVLALTVIV